MNALSPPPTSSLTSSTTTTSWIEIWSTGEQVRSYLSAFRVTIKTTHLAQTAYKNKSGGFKQDELRRRREEQQVEIRRQKREENISKRRNLATSSGPDSDDDVGGANFDAPVSHIARYPRVHGISFLTMSICLSFLFAFGVLCGPIALWSISASSTRCGVSITLDHDFPMTFSLRKR